MRRALYLNDVIVLKGSTVVTFQGFVISMAFLMAGPLAAHEFWLEAKDYTVDAGQPVLVELRVGQDFGGSQYPYVKQRFKSFDVNAGGKTTKYTGRAGDRPAYQDTAPETGLQVLAYHSKPDTLKFRESKPDLLATYLKAEGLDFVLKKHREDGLPEVGISEIYTRNAKTLVQVGPYAGGEDRAFGMPFELVVEGSPYDGDSSVTVQLLRDGMPVPNYPINVFTKRGETKQTRVQTNGSGKATVRFEAGSKVLLNSVWIERLPKSSEHFYQSWWASTTFGR